MALPRKSSMRSPKVCRKDRLAETTVRFAESTTSPWKTRPYVTVRARTGLLMQASAASLASRAGPRTRPLSRGRIRTLPRASTTTRSPAIVKPTVAALSAASNTPGTGMSLARTQAPCPMASSSATESPSMVEGRTKAAACA